MVFSSSAVMPGTLPMNGAVALRVIASIAVRLNCLRQPIVSKPSHIC